MTDLERAKLLAVGLHAAQRYGDEPFIVHPQAVAERAAHYGLPLAVQVAAWLHDTIEDTGTTRAEIAAEFGAEVAELVWLVSDAPGVTRKQKLTAMLERTRGGPTSHLRTSDTVAPQPAPAGATDAPDAPDASDATRGSAPLRESQTWNRRSRPSTDGVGSVASVASGAASAPTPDRSAPPSNLPGDIHHWAVALKLCDRWANVNASLLPTATRNYFKMYRDEYPRFREGLYRPGEWDTIWADLDAQVLAAPPPNQPPRRTAP